MSGSKAKDITGMRFGKLTVISRNPNRLTTSGKSIPNWFCRCDCGRYRDVDGSALRAGYVRSCGCTKHVPEQVNGTISTKFKAPVPITVQDRLVIGKTYTIKGRRLRLVGIYHGFARFRDKNGFHECYMFSELEGKI